MKTDHFDLSKYAPIALGVVCGGVAVPCLCLAAALMRLDGAGFIAFAALSGGFFWASWVIVAVLIWIDRREREAFAARREALLAQLKRGARRTA